MWQRTHVAPAGLGCPINPLRPSLHRPAQEEIQWVTQAQLEGPLFLNSKEHAALYILDAEAREHESPPMARKGVLQYKYVVDSAGSPHPSRTAPHSPPVRSGQTTRPSGPGRGQAHQPQGPGGDHGHRDVGGRGPGALRAGGSPQQPQPAFRAAGPAARFTCRLAAGPHSCSAPRPCLRLPAPGISAFSPSPAAPTHMLATRRLPAAWLSLRLLAPPSTWPRPV